MLSANVRAVGLQGFQPASCSPSASECTCVNSRRCSSKTLILCMRTTKKSGIAHCLKKKRNKQAGRNKKKSLDMLVQAWLCFKPWGVNSDLAWRAVKSRWQSGDRKWRSLPLCLPSRVHLRPSGDFPEHHEAVPKWDSGSGKLRHLLSGCVCRELGGWQTVANVRHGLARSHQSLQGTCWPQRYIHLKPLRCGFNM